jgi:hypothetical protein
MRDAIRTASYLHNAGIVDVASISVICGWHLQGCFLPSFGHDLEKERRLASLSMVPACRTIDTLYAYLSEAHRAAEFTIRIKSQIIRAIMEGCCPVVVSMGTNAMSHNWSRFSLFHHEFEATYGPLNIWIHITASEGMGSRQETSKVTCLGAIDWRFIGAYNVDGHQI